MSAGVPWNMDDQVAPGALKDELDRCTTLREQDLLCSVVDLVRRCPGRPSRAGLDAVLAGRASGRLGPVALPTQQGRKRNPAPDASAPPS